MIYRLYLAGPMRGIPQFNFPAFDSAAVYLRSIGHEVFSPAENDRTRHGDDFGKDNATGDEHTAAGTGFNLRVALGEDLAWICKHAEGIALLPGWEASKGANAEKKTAEALGLTIIYLHNGAAGWYTLDGPTPVKPIHTPALPLGDEGYGITMIRDPLPAEKKMQTSAKTVNFGIAYGEGEKKMRTSAKTVDFTALEKFNRELMDYHDGTKPSNPKDVLGIMKAPLSVLPTQVSYKAALGMLEGALKYGRHNYRVIGVRASIYYDACKRHLDSWWEGEDLDPDSKAGLHHLDKLIASAYVVRDAILQDMFNDDRPPKVKNKKWMEENHAVVKRLLAAHPNPVKPYTELNKEEPR